MTKHLDFSSGEIPQTDIPSLVKQAQSELARIEVPKGISEQREVVRQLEQRLALLLVVNKRVNDRITQARAGADRKDAWFVKHALYHANLLTQEK